MDKVISSMNKCDFTKFTDDDVLAVLEKDILEPRDFECLLSPVAQNHLEAIARSEEHTSELQSRQYLVCRLLLEKKKSTTFTTSTISRITSSITSCQSR